MKINTMLNELSHIRTLRQNKFKKLSFRLLKQVLTTKWRNRRNKTPESFPTKKHLEYEIKQNSPFNKIKNLTKIITNNIE